MIDYIAVLDFDHMDNGLFLGSLATAIAQRGEQRGLWIHGDSAYTDRLIQTGMMREEAKVRAMRDLNHRLIALLADHGVSAIGLNGHQRKLVTLDTDESRINIDLQQLERLPAPPQLILSALGITHKGERVSLPLPRLVSEAARQLDIEQVYLFHASDDQEILSDGPSGEIDSSQIGTAIQREEIPTGFDQLSVSVHLTTAQQFRTSPPRSLHIRPSSSAAT